MFFNQAWFDQIKTTTTKKCKYTHLHPYIQNTALQSSLSLNTFISLLVHPSFFSACGFAVRENKMFSENEIRNIMFQVLSGLAFVHKHGKKLSFAIL